MWTLQDAKNKFSAVVEAALAGEPQEVTRRGEPAVVVISAAQYARMRGASDLSFVDHLKSFPGDFATDRAEVQPRDVSF